MEPTHFQTHSPSETEWIIGHSHLAESIKTKDWTQTPLGFRNDWPLSLKYTVNFMLTSAFPIAILWGPQLILIYNDAYQVIAGDRHPDALGKSTYQVWPEVEYINRPIFEATMIRGETIFLENSLFPISRNGKGIEPAWFTLSYSPIYDEYQNIRGTLVILIETTQKVIANQHIQNEHERIKRFVEDMPASVAMFDREMKLIYASKRYLIDHHISESNPWGKSIFDLIPGFPDHWKNSHEKCISGQHQLMSEEKIAWPDHSTDWIKWEMSPWVDLQGKSLGVLWSSVIINDLKKLEDELRTSVEIRDEFMSIASHELRNPLTALQLQIEVLKKRMEKAVPKIDQSIIKLIEKSEKSMMAIASLVDDLMDITRIRSGKLDIECRAMNMQSTLIEATQAVIEEASKKGSKISIDAKQPIVGYWDPLRINQVLHNLLTNAIKYGNGKEIKLSLSKDQSRGVAKIQVEDAGIGIPLEIQDVIFNRFERGKIGNGIAGLGLGLYIVRKIVSAHGGTIQVKSEPGKGSLFTVELPISMEQMS